ncbi:MAG: transcriptional regulator PpsR [Nevskia sp.]
MSSVQQAEVAEIELDQGADFVNQAGTSKKALGGLDAESAASLIAAAADVALVLDSDGMIRDVSFGSEEMSVENCGRWIGQAWAETVTPESRPKVELLLREASSKASRKWRQVNHTSSRGADVPVLYSAIKIGAEGPVIAFGRDLRANAALQQRLIDAQQSLERDYWRLRHVETRYRLLFQMSSEAVLIIDSSTQKVLEANPAASLLLGETARKLVGTTFPDGFDEAGTRLLETLLAGVRAIGRAEDVRVRQAGQDREFKVSATLFRQENASFFLIRLSPSRAEVVESAASRSLLKVMDSAPDGFVVTDASGHVMTANRAFLDLTEMAAEAQVKGERLDRWLGHSGVDYHVLMTNLRQHGSVRLFASKMTGEHGGTTEVEISGVSVPHGDQTCLGFTIRNVGRRVTAEASAGRSQPRSPNQLTELVGRVPLKELVRESTDLIERLCIEAALQLTSDNRASAAEMLGLSRQSLYVKLRRYGMGDLDSEDEEAPAP